MTLYPCAGCGRVVVVEHCLCVDCERSLTSAPIVPRLRLDDADKPTSLVDATLLLEDATRFRVHNRALPETSDLRPGA